MEQEWIVTGSKVSAHMISSSFVEVEKGDVVTIELRAPGKQSQTWLMRVDAVDGRYVYMEAIDIIRQLKQEGER